MPIGQVGAQGAVSGSGGGTSGVSGYSGFSGDNQGSSGYSGFTGKSGYSGFSGANPGASGYSGFTGISGYSGFTGASGYSGYSGTSGISGFSGSLGGSTGSTDNAALRADGTGGATLQNSNLTIADDAAVSEVGYMNIPQNSKSADYTLVLADRGGQIYHPLSDDNPRTFTIPSSSVAYAVGTAISFINDVNTITIAITSDTLVLAGTGSTGSRTLAAKGMATAVKVASTRWYINGTGLT